MRELLHVAGLRSAAVLAVIGGGSSISQVAEKVGVSHVAPVASAGELSAPDASGGKPVSLLGALSREDD
ncbi:hypothetical protein MAAFP003_2522 [Mycobacterium ahvazicum]|uniref:Uncharacterized protein n=1 Tax=Mycobacterium ahvazicum TaxID=1964395 RepID=A0A2K4YAM6_9MYCO|nr:hypothetical protein [Mycobacterium ahvazicum]SOX53846.1 hypothetical protein MAAFP003_2522 [Mycobacterium ahvazicum]